MTTSTVADVDPITLGVRLALQRLLGLAIPKLAKAANKARVRTALRGQPVTITPLHDLRLELEESAQVNEFLRSAEFDHVASLMCRAILLEGDGKKGDQLQEAARDLLIRSTRKVTSRTDIIEAIWQGVVDSVSAQLVRMELAESLHPRIKAEIFKLNASVAAASARNLEIPLDADRFELFNTFDVELAKQVRQVHSRMKLPHVGSARQVTYDELFVEPQLTYQDAERQRHASGAPVSLSSILQLHTRVVIVGDPGGGKSTLSVKLAHDIAAGVGPLPATGSLFVLLKDYADSTRGAHRLSLIEYMESLCKVPYATDAPEGALEYLLLNNRLVVIFDGIDELLDVSLRTDVVRAVEGFAHKYPTTSILVTSRRIGYSDAPLDDALFTLYGLHDFSPTQVETYSEKWFALDDSISNNEQYSLQRSFIEDSTFVSDLRVNPLMLSLMCGIYATEKYIPRNRPEVYDKCAEMLFERWDRQRGIEGGLPFDAHVKAAMRALALHMYNASSTSTTMTRQNLVEFVKSYLHGRRFASEEDAENAAVQFVDFCKGRAWVLTDVGADMYGFTHRTFLEYFSASQIVRQSATPGALLERLEGSISQGSATMVNQLALQIFGKYVEDGADDFLELALGLLVDGLPAHRRRSWLLFVVNSLSFIVPRPAIIEAIVDEWVKELVREDGRRPDALGPSDVLESLQECALENIPAVQAAVRKSVDSQLRLPRSKEIRLLSLVVLHPCSRFLGTDSRGLEPWVRWGRENAREYRDRLLKRMRSSTWAGPLLADLGEVSITDALNGRGIEGLYGHQNFEDLRLAPFAWRVLSGDLESAGLIVAPLKVPKAQALQREVVALLVARDTPWVSSLRHARVFSQFLWRRRIKRDTDLSLMLYLPILEWNERNPGKAPYVPHSLEEDQPGRRARKSLLPELELLAEARRRGRVSRTRVAEIRRLASDVTVADYLERWSKGTVSTLA